MSKLAIKKEKNIKDKMRSAAEAAGSDDHGKSSSAKDVTRTLSSVSSEPASGKTQIAWWHGKWVDLMS